MNRAPAVLLLALLSLSAHAQPADRSVIIESTASREATDALALATDFSVTITPYSTQTGQPVSSRVPVNTTVNYVLTFARSGEPPAPPLVFDFDVPGEIVQVTPFDANVVCNGTKPIRCSVLDTAPNVFQPVSVTTRLTTPGNATATVTIVNPNLGPRAASTIDVVDKPSLSVSPGFNNNRLEPSQEAQFSALVTNAGRTAHNVTLAISLPNGGTIRGIDVSYANFDCQITGATTATCHAAELPFGGFLDATVHFTAPDRLDGGLFRAELKVTADEEDFDPSNLFAVYETELVRHLVVTNTNDEGGGSLRQAILDSNTLCAIDPCVIEFRIDGAEPHVIQPRTQLPNVRGVVKIDGGDPSKVIVDGSLQPEGNGLVLADGCELQVVNLAVRNFVNSAVEARRGTPSAAECNARFTRIYPDTLVAGNVLTSSNRSIVVMDTGTITIRDNVLSGNRRSGIFAQRSFYLDIHDNRIENNGRSGIFLDVGSRDYVAGGADITRNVITGNFEWGICRTRSGEIAIQSNTIAGNRYLPIDFDLDFESPNRPNDAGQPPNKPELIDATYHADTNTTVVRGTLFSVPAGGASFQVEFFADAVPVLIQQFSSASPDGPGAFEVALPGDFRGKQITATNTRVHIIGFAKPPKVSSQSHLYSIPGDTSEMSNGVVAF